MSTTPRKTQMAKIVLGKTPEKFTHKITVKLLDGTDGVITMTFKYRTRKQFGEFVDGLFGAAQVQPDSMDAAELAFKMAVALAKVNDTNADYIMEVACGWDLEAEFNRDNVAKLCDELPGVALAIINSYAIAVREGRLGN